MKERDGTDGAGSKSPDRASKREAQSSEVYADESKYERKLERWNLWNIEQSKSQALRSSNP